MNQVRLWLFVYTWLKQSIILELKSFQLSSKQNSKVALSYYSFRAIIQSFVVLRVKQQIKFEKTTPVLFCLQTER